MELAASTIGSMPAYACRRSSGPRVDNECLVHYAHIAVLLARCVWVLLEGFQKQRGKVAGAEEGKLALQVEFNSSLGQAWQSGSQNWAQALADVADLSETLPHWLSMSHTQDILCWQSRRACGLVHEGMRDCRA